MASSAALCHDHATTRDLAIARHFSKLKDPRRRHRRRHRLQDIIVIALCAVIANAQDWQQILAQRYPLA